MKVVRVVVCREIDRSHLGVMNAAPLPNDNTMVEKRWSPWLHFVGAGAYEPDRLAMQWIIDGVLPAVCAEVPAFGSVMVGDNDVLPVRRARTTQDVLTIQSEPVKTDKTPASGMAPTR